MNKLAKYDQQLTYIAKVFSEAKRIAETVRGLTDIQPTIIHQTSKNGNHRWLIQFDQLEFDQYYYIMGIFDALLHS